MDDGMLARCFAHQQGPEPTDAYVKKRDEGLLARGDEAAVLPSPTWDYLPPSDPGVDGAVPLTIEVLEMTR